MQKIMFKDNPPLTKSVIEEDKINTRRDMKPQPTGNFVGIVNYTKKGKKHKGIIYQRADFDCGTSIDAPYHVGEIVAIAQSYTDVDESGNNKSLSDFIKDEYQDIYDKLGYEGNIYFHKHPGWYNKMFVKAELMPHHIKILSIRAERLQDISDEDCLKEGIYLDQWENGFAYRFPNCDKYGYDDAYSAFEHLIEKVSGKGTWKSNPYVWVYEFELVKKEL